MKATNTGMYLYVTEWASNGTNDLLIVRDGEVVDCLPEAVFGVDVTRCAIRAGLLCDHGAIVDALEVDYVHCVLVAEVSLEQVRTALAVSPVLSDRDASSRLARALIRSVA